LKVQREVTKMRRIFLMMGIGIGVGSLTLMGISAAGADGTVRRTAPRNQADRNLPSPPPWDESNHPAELPIAGPDGELLRNPDGSLQMRAWPSMPPPPAANAD
jgi:hypothetical protein